MISESAKASKRYFGGSLETFEALFDVFSLAAR
jgi:hypothetical protein